MCQNVDYKQVKTTLQGEEFVLMKVYIAEIHVRMAFKTAYFAVDMHTFDIPVYDRTW